MKSYQLSLRFPSGSVLIGGYTAVPMGLHAVHAQDSCGRPIIPATALRGALRETLEALLRGAGLDACSGGDGLPPGQATAAKRAVPCIDRDTGRRCRACQMFGSQRAGLDPEERSFSGLVLGEAKLAADVTPRWTVRPGVGVARKRRGAEDHHLFMRKVPMVADDAFVATGRLLDSSLAPLFEIVVKNTTHLGAGRSRGLARVQIELNWVDSTTPEIAGFPLDGDVRVRMTLESPALIGVPVVTDNVRECRREIPGSTLRGAVGFALSELLTDPTDAAFQQLVAPNGAQFGFLYPAASSAQAVVGPLPITASACKREAEKHGVVDTLLDRLAVLHITNPEQAKKVRDSRLETCSCKASLRGCSGPRGDAKKVTSRTVTRVAIDRSRCAASDEMLFSQEMLDAGSVFEGTIRNIPAQGRERLKQALSHPLSLGRGRSAGYGRVRVEVSSATALDELEVRGKRFEDALKKRLLLAGLSLDRLKHLVPITLLAPLVTSSGAESDDGAELLRAALGAKDCFLRARRFSREGGWDQRVGKMQPVLATAAGGIFVMNLDRDWREVVPLLKQLEQQGIGERRCQGYGQLLCFDPFFLSQTLTR